MRTLRLLALAVIALPSLAHTQSRVPSIDDLINLRTLAGSRISPDGKWVAYGVNEADWTQDVYVTQLWVVNVASGERRQLSVVTGQPLDLVHEHARGEPVAALRDPAGRR